MNSLPEQIIPLIPSKILPREAEARADYIDSMVRNRFVICQAAG